MTGQGKANKSREKATELSFQDSMSFIRMLHTGVDKARYDLHNRNIMILMKNMSAQVCSSGVSACKVLFPYRIGFGGCFFRRQEPKKAGATQIARCGNIMGHHAIFDLSSLSTKSGVSRGLLYVCLSIKYIPICRTERLFSGDRC